MGEVEWVKMNQKVGWDTSVNWPESRPVVHRGGGVGWCYLMRCVLEPALE